jgi:hypothetical protein
MRFRYRQLLHGAHATPAMGMLTLGGEDMISAELDDVAGVGKPEFCVSP